MCNLRVDLPRPWNEKLVSVALALAFNRLRGMEEDGLVRLRGTTIEVTRLGRPFLRTICSVFDQYIKDRAAVPQNSFAI